MIEIGKVISVSDGRATVRFARRGECESCRICAAVKDGVHSELNLPNDLDIGVGDFVRVEVYNKKVRVLSVLLYFIPLLLTALGAGIGTLMSLGASIILAIAGLIVGLAFAVPIDICVVRKKSGFSPRMTGVCTEADYTQAVNDQRAKAIKYSEAEKVTKAKKK